MAERRESEQRKISQDLAGDRRFSDVSSTFGGERKSSEMYDRKLSELSDVTAGEDDLSLQLVEKRQLRSFSRADEYLYAMKEDLAEWLNLLYPWLHLDPDTFMDKLQTGEHLLRHANAVRRKHVEILELISRGEYSRNPQIGRASCRERV